MGNNVGFLVGKDLAKTFHVVLYFLFALGSSEDITWTYTNSMIWSAVELSVAVTCASIPAIAPSLKRARGGANVRKSSRPRWHFLGSQVLTFKAKMKHGWRRSGQEGNQSLVELGAD